MKSLLMLCSFWCLPCLVFAQTSVSGTVSDKISGKPLSGATIQLDGSFVIVVTNSEGRFTINNLNSEKISLTIRFLGYKEAKLLVDGSRSENLVIQLETSAVLTDEIIISSTRANRQSAMAISDISKEELQKSNTGRDIPFLLESVPSLVPTSDAGTGVGYTGMRIRGSDASRINVTVNGIPVNDSESQLLYWVDMPDLASSIENIQVQRGVGTSTNGAGAFGGSVNIKTSSPSDSAFAIVSTAAGSFNTFKNNIVFGSGMLKNHWNFEGRLSKITSDGYIDRATSDLKSYFVSGGYYGKKDLVKLNVFSGKEVTYQSWYGVPEASLDTNRTWNYYTYDNQVDDYQQDHYQLFYTREIINGFHLNTAFHYTHGKGFYEEYKEDESFSDYLLDNPFVGNDTVTSTDLIRRKWLDNDFYGCTWSLNYDLFSYFDFILGGAWNQYDGDHFGEVIWAQYASNGNIRHRYYDNNGLKTDFNIFLKSTISLTEKLSLFGDVQYRRVGYNFTGIDDNLEPLPQSDHLQFFNPKGGITYTVKPGTYGYLSFSIGNKEPSRDDYTESSINSRPLPERLYDFESGYYFSTNKFMAGFNYFLMLYDNQLVLTGQINDVGNYTRTNTGKSSREGIEIEAGWNPVQYFSMKGNLTLSKSKISEFKQYTDDYDNGGQVLQIYKNTDIAFSPAVTGYLSLSAKPLKSLEASLITRYVGEQYLDNTSDKNSQINPWFTQDLRLNWVIRANWIDEIILTGSINNLLDVKYESNGYTFSYISGGEKNTENYYYPQAGRNFSLQLTMKF